METYTRPKKLVKNPHYQKQKERSVAKLNNSMIDKPIINIVNSFNKLSYCFTLQCCFGHFIYEGQKNLHNFKPLNAVSLKTNNIKYKIAFIAFCVQNNKLGKIFLKSVARVEKIDPKSVQFCCAEWFWKNQVNSFVLQVEPEEFKHQDTALLNIEEALHIERIRNEFFVSLEKIIKRYKTKHGVDSITSKYYE